MTLLSIHDLYNLKNIKKAKSDEFSCSWIDFSPKSTIETSPLWFMDDFTFPPLNELRKALEDSKVYSKEEIDEEIKALSELPEYKN